MSPRTVMRLAQLLCGSAFAATSAAQSVARNPAAERVAGEPEPVGDDADEQSLVEGFDELNGRVKMVSPYMHGQHLAFQQDILEQRERATTMFQELADENAVAKLGVKDLEESLHAVWRGNRALRRKVKHLRDNLASLRGSLKKLKVNLTVAAEFGEIDAAESPEAAAHMNDGLRVLKELRESEERTKAKDDHERRVRDILEWPALDMVEEKMDKEDGMALLDVGRGTSRDPARSYLHALEGVQRLRRTVHGAVMSAKTQQRGLQARVDQALREKRKEANVLKGQQAFLEKKLASAKAARKVLDDAVAFLENEQQELIDTRTSVATYVAEVGRQALQHKNN